MAFADIQKSAKHHRRKRSSSKKNTKAIDAELKMIRQAVDQITKDIPKTHSSSQPEATTEAQQPQVIATPAITNVARHDSTTRFLPDNHPPPLLPSQAEGESFNPDRLESVFVPPAHRRGIRPPDVDQNGRIHQR